MNIIDKKPQETPPNYFYGVDVNDKAAVEKEYHRLKKKRFLINIVTICVLFVLGFFVYDFVGVNFMDKDPIIYKRVRVDGGYLHQGFGYGRLYCDNGEKYAYVGNKNKCLSTATTFRDVFTNNFREFAVENELMDIEKLQSLEIVDIVNDGTNDNKGTDYVVDIRYVCIDGNYDCFYKFKTQEEYGTYKLFVSVNSLNKVTSITSFKTYGTYYDTLVEDYKTKLQEYMVDKGIINKDNLKYFEVSLLNNYGRIKNNDIYYYDSYRVKINYTCQDNTNTCINKEGFTYENLLNFNLAMLVDKDGNIVELKNEAILDI